MEMAEDLAPVWALPILVFVALGAFAIAYRFRHRTVTVLLTALTAVTVGYAVLWTFLSG